MFLLLLLIVLIVFADQLTKWLAVVYLKYSDGVDVIPGVLRFEYTENRGMAFGLLDGHRWVFMVVSVVMISALLLFLWRRPPKSRLCVLSLAFIVGGGIGNMIDRTLLGYVIDFIYPNFIPELWPWVFNVADSFVTVGTGMLMGYLIFDTVREYRKERAASTSGEKPTGGERGDDVKADSVDAPHAAPESASDKASEAVSESEGKDDDGTAKQSDANGKDA